MKETKRYKIISMLALMLAATLIFSGSSAAFEEGGLVLLNSHDFTWTDPESEGSVIITENVYEGCYNVDGSFNPHDMTWEYVVNNIDYNPILGATNGFSGFQLQFPQQVPELYGQVSPPGAWEMNAYSGVFPPWGAEWDIKNSLGLGIMPGEEGVFSFCTYEREDVVVESQGIGSGPAGWAHTWLNDVQVNIFHGFQSVPGDLLFELDIACSEDDKICKKVKYMDENRDGYIEVGEEVEFLQVIQVHNPTGQVWSDVKVSDRFGAEIEVVKHDATQGTVVLTTKGNSEKVFIEWDVGDLGPGETANLVLRTKTDITPGGHQSYTECSYHEYNSGAVVKFMVEGNKKPRQESYDTGEIIVSVLTPGLAGDCDLDGFIDETELNLETDPHDPADYPSCGGSSIVDICIDLDGTASRNAGTLADAQVLKMDVLTSWPDPLNLRDIEGLDWFDTDGTCTWTLGDDLHVEGSAYSPPAIRDGWHDDGLDPIVLDLDLSLDSTVGRERVDVDLETGTTFTGCPGVDPKLMYYDANGVTNWDDGEDIILDVNGNGVFD